MLYLLSFVTILLTALAIGGYIDEKIGKRCKKLKS